jgi:threonine dehydratase
MSEADPIVSHADVAAAVSRVGDRVRRTPVIDVHVEDVADVGGRPVVMKLEFLQHTGSFKPRGMFNRLLACEVDDAGVIIASGGNAGLATAHAATELEHRAEVFVPATSPAAKIDRIRALGAEVTQVGDEYAEALIASRRRAAETGALELHAYDQPEVVAGQGTCAAELAEQAPDVDTVLVAAGGGGLIGGIAAWYSGDVRVIAVEPKNCPTLHTALGAGGPVDVCAGMPVVAGTDGTRGLGQPASTERAMRPTPASSTNAAVTVGSAWVSECRRGEARRSSRRSRRVRVWTNARPMPTREIAMPRP